MNLSTLNPGAREHWLRADEDLQDCRDLLDAGKHRWAITALFYSALHRVNAYLVQRGRQPTSHDLRERLVARELPAIADDYLALKQRSERARYWPGVTITGADVQSMLDGEYQAIVAGITARLP